NSLDQDEKTYIENDVILLAKSVYYYSKLFNGFDYSKMTFTSNILESYNTNDLTSYQLLNRIGSGKEKYEIRYTDYQFANQNFYDYLKPFYRGGLNFYNQYYVGKTVRNVFSIDINSSYPYAMHNFKIPTYIKNYDAFEKEKMIEVNFS
ncbi:DNA polymerase, partial [Arthrospira platensis SPKY2]